jgi:hypothetical protein
VPLFAQLTLANRTTWTASRTLFHPERSVSVRTKMSEHNAALSPDKVRLTAPGDKVVVARYRFRLVRTITTA